MAEKFLSLRSEKQRVFGLEVERFTTPAGERPVAVTAERGRITLFCGKTSGAWRSFERAHDLLDRRPRRPDRSHAYGWSRRVGVASGQDRLVLVYRRRFTRGTPPQTTDVGDLWIDVVLFDENNEELSALDAPVAVPRDSLKIDGFGLCVWADNFEDRLVIVAQAFFAGASGGPSLVLLDVPFPQDDGSGLASATWRVTTLDAGGWDFDVRREGGRLFVVHRRSAATYATDLILPIDPFFGMPPVFLSDDPAETSQPLSGMATGNLVLVEVSLPDGTVQSVDDSLPFGELPQIHRIDPFVLTMDRLRSALLLFRLGGAGIGQATVHAPRWRTLLVMATSAGWRAAPLLGETRDWPTSLVDMAEAHLLLTLQPAFNVRPVVRLELAALFSNNPVSLFDFEEAEKGRLLTFAHRDPIFASLRATRFRVFEESGGESLAAQPEGYSTLDIGHYRIDPPRTGSTPPEHVRFRPFVLDRTRNHEDGYPVTRKELETANTLAWGLSGADENPHTFYAYTDMGDGGGRVVYDQGLELLPPVGTTDDKSFAIATVPEPAQAGTAWVRLETPSLVDTKLAGYFFSFAQPRRSLASELQRSLDALPVAALTTIVLPEAQLVSQLAGGGEMVFRDEDHIANPAFVESVLLTRGTADAIEENAVNTAERDPVTSDSNQPFAIQLQISPGILFASRPILFRARVPGVVQLDDYTFDWEFSDGTTDTGRSVEHSFAATLPDVSTANPLAAPDDPITATLTVTDPDGQTSTVSTSFALLASLWATLWNGFAPFRRRSDDEIEQDEDPLTALSPGFFATHVTVDLLKYTIEYTTSDDGDGLGLRVTYKDQHTGRFQFVGGGKTGQGDTNYELPIGVTLTDVRLTGDTGTMLRGIVKVDKVDAMLLYSKRFQACVQTSERRESDVASDTVMDRGGDNPTTVPSALCCVPVGDTTVSLPRDGLTVTSSLTDEAKNLAILAAALVAAGLSVLVIAILLPVLIVLAPAAVVAIVISGGVSAIVGALVGAGLAWLGVTLLDNLVVQPLIQSAIRTGLTGPSVKKGFDDSGLLTYAGEGLAEALAVHLIRQAQADGHAVEDPNLDGRDRFRQAFFETIAVEPGRCKAKVRVPG